jgi:hypothetical protein
MGILHLQRCKACYSAADRLKSIVSINKQTYMLQKIKGLLSKLRKNRPEGEKLSEMHLQQADLSEGLMLSLRLAMKLNLRVYIRIDVGNQSHGISVQGKDDPTLEYLYDLAWESWKACSMDALEAKAADREDTEGMEGIGGDGRKGLKKAYK